MRGHRGIFHRFPGVFLAAHWLKVHFEEVRTSHGLPGCRRIPCCPPLLDDDFFWNVVEADSDEFWLLEWGHEVEVGDVHCHESCIWCGDDAVE